MPDASLRIISMYRFLVWLRKAIVTLQQPCELYRETYTQLAPLFQRVKAH
jgi:hypothetical protein